MPYEVLTWSLCDGWTNVWTTWSDENPDETPEVFDTAEEAEEAIKEEIEDTEEAIRNGDMDEGARLARNDFKIVESGSVKPRNGDEIPVIIEIKDMGESVITFVPVEQK
ncbi:MAG: hypothetical protein ACYCSB_01285 [bacterium]|jgi:hypothetical protein